MTKILNKRIDAIDALRGFALSGIIILHCVEHFLAMYYPEGGSAALGQLNDIAATFTNTIFLGKMYAIFSLLFGLGFFIQNENQAAQGKDFRLRFAWRMVILWILGLINSSFYWGEIFEIYSVLGLFIIPICKIPTKYLRILGISLLFHIPALIWFFYMAATPSVTTIPLSQFDIVDWNKSTEMLRNGSFFETLWFNFTTGRQMMWSFVGGSSYRVAHIIGLFIMGIVIGRVGIHKDEEKMKIYASKALISGFVIFAISYCIKSIVPLWLIENKSAISMGLTIFNYWFETGMMLMFIGGFILLYFYVWRDALNKLAPVGRMSLTNYLVQSLIGSTLFYGYGFALAEVCGPAVSMLIGLVWCICQIIVCNYWINRYYYGPLEWFWRSLTWFSFTKFAFKKQA